MSNNVLRISEVKCRREGSRIYLLLKDGTTWIRSEIPNPVAFFSESLELARRAEVEAKFESDHRIRIFTGHKGGRK